MNEGRKEGKAGKREAREDGNKEEKEGMSDWKGGGTEGR